MALTGSMRDFGISEILQMIGLQKKSGILTVTDKKRKVEILFDQGSIVKAEHQPPDDLYDLGRVLVRSELLKEAEVKAAELEAQRTVKPLPQVLLSRGLLSAEEIRSFITLVHLEIIYSLFFWKEGNYSFEQGPISYATPWTESISAEGVLMDGYRIKDEWPLVEQAIPDMNVHLEKTAGEFGPTDKLTPEEKRLYDLIDGQRTAGDLVFLSRLGYFETFKILKDLVEKGRVQVAGRREKPVRREKPPVTFLAAALAGLIVGTAAVGAGIYRQAERHVGSKEASRPAKELWFLYQGDQVIQALMFFSAREGRYPASLEELIKQEIAPARTLSSAVGEMEYQSDSSGLSCSLSLRLKRGGWAQEEEISSSPFSASQIEGRRESELAAEGEDRSGPEETAGGE